MKLSLVVAALAAVASAVTPANYANPPSGNPIYKPGLSERVPVGQPYTVTWDPTTQGPISILLLRGPSTNCVPIGTIAEGVPNTGSFTWTPSTDLEDDTSRYGIQIIVEGTGEYQYSTQFGIKNDGHQKPSKPSSTAEKPTWTRLPSAPATHIVVPSSTGGVVTLTTSVCPPTGTAVPSAPFPTSSQPAPGTPQPTGTGAPLPPPSATATPPPFNNGAGRLGAGLGAALFLVAAAFAM